VNVYTVLTLWRPLLAMGTTISVPDRVKLCVICNFWHPGTLTLSPERQSAQMSKITNDVQLNRVWHRMLYSCTVMATVGVKWINGLIAIVLRRFGFRTDAQNGAKTVNVSSELSLRALTTASHRADRKPGPKSLTGSQTSHCCHCWHQEERRRLDGNGILGGRP